MNPDFEAQGSECPAFPEGRSVSMAGRPHSEPRVAFLRHNYLMLHDN